ncbi:MAG TPA: hypothetical protein VJ841_03625 [Candidatus Saccharimonadales bacterium]|nr:hypothetical protein [Candidatus Saccharimonadales bacterium]
MLVPELIAQSYQQAVGEATPPAVGDENYKLLFNSANLFIDTWQDEEGVDWESLWDRTTLNTPVTATDEFPIDKTVVRKLSTKKKSVYITCTNGNVVDFKVVKPSDLNKGGKRVALKSGKLKFAEAFSNSSECIGGAITFSYYGFAPKLVDATSEVPVDQAWWLVFMVAAEFASKDYTRQNLAPDLIAQANAIMKSMIANNNQEEDPSIDHGDWQPLSETFR